MCATKMNTSFPEERVLSIKMSYMLKTVKQYQVTNFPPYKYKTLRNKEGASS